MIEKESILTSIKKLLGLPKEYDAFDTDIEIHINSVFSTLQQLGVGPTPAFYITGPEEKWSDFLIGEHNLNTVRSYVFLRVRLLFDPPPHAFLVTAVQDQIKEMEWRLIVHADSQVVMNQNGTQ